MDQILIWFKTSPIAVPVIGIAILLVTFFISWIIKTLKRSKTSSLFEAAKSMGMELIESSSSRVIYVPRLTGYVEDRNVEITGHDVIQRMRATGYVRIKMTHDAYLVRKVLFEYNSSKDPALQKVTVEDKESELEDLLKMEAFDDKVLADIGEFLNSYTEGDTEVNSILTFSIGEIIFDRDVSLIGSADDVVSCVEELLNLARYMEEITKKK